MAAVQKSESIWFYSNTHLCLHWIDIRTSSCVLQKHTKLHGQASGGTSETDHCYTMIVMIGQMKEK